MVTHNCCPGYWRAAATGTPMRAGQHYAEFTVADQKPWRSGWIQRPWTTATLGEALPWFGIIRPDFVVSSVDDEDGDWERMWATDPLENGEGHHFYQPLDGTRLGTTTDGDWEGMQSAAEKGDRVGMLLDLHAGNLVVYKNGVRLGVLASGLTGAYTWAVALYDDDDECLSNSACIATTRMPEEK